MMDLPGTTVADLVKHLRRVEGGLQQMLVDGRECRDVVTQMSAASKALDQAGFKLIASGLAYCATHPEDAARDGYDIDEVQQLFMKLA